MSYHHVVPYVDEFFSHSNFWEALMAILIGILIFFAIYCIIIVVSNWKIFEKAGEPGWASLIPIYNVALVLKISGLSPLLLLLTLIPKIGAFAFSLVIIISRLMLAKSFGKSWLFGIGLIFLNIIFLPILAFSDAKYIGFVVDEEPARDVTNENDTVPIIEEGKTKKEDENIF